MKTYILSCIYILGLALFMLMAACGSEEEHQASPDNIEEISSDQENGLAEATPLMNSLAGKWRLMEMRISGMDPIQQPESYLILDKEGSLTISNPSDPDLEDYETTYSAVKGMLNYDGASFEILSLSPDSLVLSNEVDQEQVRSYYVRVE